jgi:hypothetical protein
VAIVHRRVQLLFGHLDRGGLFGDGSTVAWGGSGDRFRLHLVACARTRSARDGRGGHRCLGVGEDVSQGTRESAQGECKQGERSGPSGRRPHTKQRRDLGGTDAGGAGSTVQSAGATGGRRRLLHGRGGPGAAARTVTRGEANKVI